MALNTHSISILSDGEVQDILISTDDVFGVCYHDYDLYKLSRPSRNKSPRGVVGLPETVFVLDTNGFVLLTEEIQWYWYNWCKALSNQTDNDAKSSFFSLTTSDRAYTNRYGSNAKGIFPACANYPCGTNLDKEPMRLFPLLNGGTYIKILGGLGTNILTYETMSSDEDLSQYSPSTHPWLYSKPSNSIREEIWWDKQTHKIVPRNTPRSIWSGKYIENKVTPFPQFKNKTVVPIITRGAKFNRIASYKVKILPMGSLIPSPFVN